MSAPIRKTATLRVTNHVRNESWQMKGNDANIDATKAYRWNKR